MSEILVRVFNRLNKVVGEIRPHITEISWLRNQYGLARMVMSPGDSKATDEFIQIGNRVLIEPDNDLPPFGGVMDTPRKWSAGAIGLSVYSGEYLLKLRRTDRGRYFTNTPVGTIAQKLVEEANAIRATGLTIGEIWPGGDAHGPEYHYGNLYEIFTQSLFSRLSTAEFAVIPSYANGQIIFTLNVYERRGSDKPGIGLHEGFNVADSSNLEEQGPIFNDVVAVGAGENWGSDRPIAQSVEQDSIDVYGLREDALINSSTDNLLTLQAAADTKIADSASPHNLFTIKAVNRSPGTYGQYDVGDSLLAELPNFRYGFRGMVHVNGRTFFPDQGACDLVVREE